MAVFTLGMLQADSSARCSCLASSGSGYQPRPHPAAGSAGVQPGDLPGLSLSIFTIASFLNPAAADPGDALGSDETPLLGDRDPAATEMPAPAR